MNDRQALLFAALPLLAALVLLPGGCAVVAALPDSFGPMPDRELSQRQCDFGILRGTKEMRCADELNRKAWF